MKIFCHSSSLALTLAFLTSTTMLGGRPASAAILSGGFIVTVADATNHVWDVTPIEELQMPDLDFSDGGGTTVSWSAPFSQNGAGKLAGAGDTVMDVFADIFEGQVDATYASKGSLTSSKGIARLSLVSSARGQTMIDGRLRTLSASAGVKLAIDSRSEVITGTYASKASASGFGSLTDNGEINYTWEDFITAVGDGSWTLELNLNNDGVKKLIGTAVVTLSTGQELSFAVKGTYNAKKDSSLLILTADPANKGSSLKVTIDGGGAALVSGKLSGQQIKTVSVAHVN